MKNQIHDGNAIALNYSVPADGAPLTAIIAEAMAAEFKPVKS